MVNGTLLGLLGIVPAEHKLLLTSVATKPFMAYVTFK